MRAQHPARERENDAAREDATAEVSYQITTDSTQEREREAETSTSTTDRWILTGVASSIGGLCRHTVATSTVCVTKGTRGLTKGTRGPAKGTGWISLLIGTRGDQGTGDDEGDQGTGEGDRMDLAINRDQRGPEGPAMAEINARTLMLNLGREDAIDSTTSAKIARYAERKQLAYKLTDEGVLLLDGRGKKIHLRNGVVTLRNALGLHALPERCHAIGDNRVLNKQQQHTNVVTMLHVRKMALVDPRLLKSLRAPLPDPTSDAIDTALRDLDAEMTSILDGSDADESEKVRLYNQALLRYNDMTKARAAKPTPVVVMKSDTVDNVPAAGATVETAVVTGGQSTDPVNIVGTLPKTLQEKGRQLLSRLSKVAWNERGELMHEGVPIPASNAVDLVHDLLRNRKTARDPVGWRQFAKQMRSANIPLELVGSLSAVVYYRFKRLIVDIADMSSKGPGFAYQHV